MQLEIASIDERINRLEAAAKKCDAEIESRDEALCLYSEVVKLLEAEAVVRPKEVDSLLARIRALVKK